MEEKTIDYESYAATTKNLLSLQQHGVPVEVQRAAQNLDRILAQTYVQHWKEFWKNYDHKYF